jgi:hypothetical protein
MMSRLFLKRKKTIAALVAAMTIGSAFQTGGCTVNVDENLLRQLVGSVSGSVDFDMHRPGPPPGPGHNEQGPGSGPHQEGEDEAL